MAQLYPKQPVVKTAGEKRVLAYLQHHLNDSWLIFYEPIIEFAKPDIVLYSPYYGILILEIKDYTYRTIHSLAPDYWTIYAGNSTRSITAPLKQVEEYAFKIVTMFERHEMLLQSEGAFQGKLKFPVMYACWFVNLSWDNIHDLHIDKVMPKKWIFTQETFKSINEFELMAQQIIKSRFSIQPLSHKATDEVRSILYPEHVSPSLEKRRLCWFEAFKQHIIIFPDTIDEMLFIATEIRHLQSQGKRINPIVVCYDEKRDLKNKSIKEQLLEVFSDMGVLTSNKDHGESVRVIAFADMETSLTDSTVFVLDIKQSTLTDKKEASLSMLLKDASQRAYFTSSDIS